MSDDLISTKCCKLWKVLFHAVGIPVVCKYVPMILEFMASLIACDMAFCLCFLLLKSSPDGEKCEKARKESGKRRRRFSRLDFTCRQDLEGKYLAEELLALLHLWPRLPVDLRSEDLPRDLLEIGLTGLLIWEENLWLSLEPLLVAHLSCASLWKVALF